MQELPVDWNALCLLVFLLGMRHGLDADHLAAIDGLTRLAAHRGHRWARRCGGLFSLGHGAVVVALALGVGVMRDQWTAPPWLDALGAWISIAFLLLLGMANLRAVLRTPAGAVVSLVGLKSSLFRGVMQAQRPLAVAGVGALFALSFDTVSQTLLFSVAASQFGGVLHALTLGLLFLLGMLLTDGLNGWWISGLIARADSTAAIASRVMGTAVAGVSLLTASLGLARQVSPAMNAWGDGKELAFGASVVGVMLASYGLARWLARADAAQAAARRPAQPAAVLQSRERPATAPAPAQEPAASASRAACLPLR